MLLAKSRTHWLFVISLFLSASLLFVIQPMVAKSLLPMYGGSLAVWAVCMLFFQAMLLAAYGYAWVLSRFNHHRYWRWPHLLMGLVSLGFIPLNFPTQAISDAPDITILANLFRQFGFPLLVIASSAPLLQFIYSRSQGKKARDPYFLYVASNVGSLLALVSYPFLIEQYSGLFLQFHYWNVIFIIYLVCLAGILFTVPLHALPEVIVQNKPLNPALMVRWISFSFIPCSLMLGVTFYITTDIAATPLFWVIPLALYLLTFIITFAEKPLISHAWVTRNNISFIIFPILGFIFGPSFLTAGQLVLFNVLNFFMMALLCHGELVKIRPNASHSTSFYLCLSLGGALAGLFNGLIAPHLFNGAYEYPIVFALSTLCIPFPKKFKGFNVLPVLIVLFLVGKYYLPDYKGILWIKKNHFIEIIILISILYWPKSRLNRFVGISLFFLFLFSSWFKTTQTIYQKRNFYGIKQVQLKEGAHVLMSGSTLHGFQLLNQKKTTNIAYYGPMFQVTEQMKKIYPKLRVSILGLGTGLMACQFRTQDKVEMVDIDEQVIAIAKNTKLFTYLRDCPPHVTIIHNDGRLALHPKQNASLDLIAIDAFSSDAIPTHLITKEAFLLYQDKITANGIVLLHSSNRHIQLLPAIAAIGQKLNWIVLHLSHPGNQRAGQFPSDWILLTANEPLARQLIREEGWHFTPFQKTTPWTDDYSNLIPLLRL